MSLEAGKVIEGKYRLVRLLGEGGMGSVYVAEHLFLKKELALKVLHPELAQRAEASARFQREARATSQIDHENVVKVTDFGCSSDGERQRRIDLRKAFERPVSGRGDGFHERLLGG